MQYKHLAELFAKAPSGSSEERAYAKKLLRWILTGAAELDEGESLLEDLMKVANKTAEYGCDRCDCGCKYWENDRCIDCGTVHDPEKFKEEVA